MTPEEIVREGYQRYARGNIAGVFALLAPEIEITQTPDLPWDGEYRGHEGARRFFAALSQHTEAMPEPLRIFSAGAEVVVIGRLRGRARATGHPIDLDLVHLWTVRDQQITRFAAYIDTPAMRTALGLEPGDTTP
jgi:ketosteroid isomerase-like protein